MHNTGNPLGSKDILDLYDNSETIDQFTNSQQDEVPDRFGTKRLTLAGLIKRSMVLRNEINDFSGALTFRPEWSDVPMNVSVGVGGEGGALNLQAEALGNRSEINKVTSREALRRSYAEAGYNLVDGSFEAGGTLVNANDVLLQERTGKAFSGPAGTVAAGTNPASGGFVDKSGVATSASAISNANGGSVQDFIDNLDQVHTRTFTNVAAMVNFNGLQAGQSVKTLGYYEAGDGGGGTYLIKSGNTGDGFVDHDCGSSFTAELVIDKNNLNVLTCGAKMTDISNPFDSSPAIISALSNARSSVVTIPDSGEVIEDDFVPDIGVYGEQTIVVPLDKTIKMESPYIYGGATYPAVQIGVPGATPATKPHNKEFKIWLMKSTPTTWTDDLEVGAVIHCSDFCTFNLHQIYGFKYSVDFLIDDSSFAYNNIYWGELRGCQTGSRWIITNGGYMNECRHYGGRISCTPVPDGQESTNRYGVVATTDNQPIENHTWFHPTFELGYSGSPSESIPFVGDKVWGLNVISARTEAHWEWVARFTGDSRDNIFESSFGKVGASVPVPIKGRDPDIIDDQSDRKTNKGIVRWQKPFLDAISSVNPEIKVYPNGGRGAVKGWSFVSSSDVVGSRNNIKALSNVRPAGQTGVSMSAGSTRLAKRIKCNGAKLILLSIDDNKDASPVIARCYDASGNDLYNASIPYVLNNIYGNAGYSAIPSWGGVYDIGYKCGKYFALTIHPDVEYIEFLFGGITYELYSISLSSPDGNLQDVDLFDTYSSASKPTWFDGVEDGLTVSNTAYTGTGTHSWRLLNGIWYDIT